MQTRIRQFSIIMIATLMLFSTTGVAIYHHICGCPLPAAQAVQVTENMHACCHQPETPPVSACCSDFDHKNCDAEQHDRCKDEVTYLKAPIISTMPVQEVTVSLISFEMPLLRRFASRSDDDAGLSDGSLRVEPLIPSHVLPPRAGGSLLILLHSLKIPFPEDIA